MVAGAHFLALLSPGPDFFLIARGALAHGWRRASGICLGIALANGLFIALALTGTSLLRPGGALWLVLQWGGSAYLAWLGWQLLRAPAAAHRDLPMPGWHTALPRWSAGLRMGLASGLLNPKNALFYASLFALLGDAATGVRWFYGAWMFTAVLAWDLAVAVAIGHPRVVARFTRQVPRIERATGVILLLLALGVVLIR
ncbi:LysE family translocator [Comamonas faecalis]|uniref:LysE family translocator n=1 Tax=Comamonas faecalis TaxID=1387849 RepID=A0ABP7RSI2_9BURK